MSTGVSAGIFVTGGTGFLGRALVRRLRDDGHAVRLLVRQAPSWAHADPGLDLVLGDLADRDAVRRASAGARIIYHVGATTRGSAKDFHDGTIAGTQHVVDACLEHGVGRLVHVSSLGVLAAPTDAPPSAVDENAPVDRWPERRGAYTHAKIAAERIVRDATAQRGLPAVVIRPGQIVGPGAERVVPNATLALGGFWLAVGPSRQTLPLVYLDDVVDAMRLAATVEGIEGRVFHVVDRHAVTHGEYLARCTSHAGDIQVIRVPAGALGMAAAVVEWAGRVTRRDLPLTRYRVRALRPHQDLDLTAATTALGWVPRVGIVEGLRTTFG